MNMFSFDSEIRRLISLRQEGEYWDFKKEWYQNKSDFLHDIICMANNLSNHDGLIIIGVDEETDYSICDVTNDTNRRRTQDIVAFLREKKFAGGIRPTVYVQPLFLRKNEIDVIVIKNDRNTPYYLTEQYQGVFANNIYARIMDTNTPKNSSADINIVEKLWKKRFGIDTAALDRALLFLQVPCDWVDSDNGKKFYKYAPEFTLEDIQAEDGRNGYEFYLFNQCDSRPRWYDINIYYHQTLLYSLGGAALDGGRCFTSTPRTDGISLYKESYHHWDISYKYFVKGSIEYIVHLCKSNLIKEFGKDHWLKLIDKMYKLGKEIGQSELQVQIDLDCYLIGIYRCFDMYEEAYEILCVQAEHSTWLNQYVLEDVVKQSGHWAKLKGILEKRVYEKKDYRECLDKLKSMGY